MYRSIFKSKIHRAVVTHADLAYEGSLTIDEKLMQAADILPYERVHIWNLTNGNRLDTYALEGAPGTGHICVNGAAAHLVHPGDLIIIATFVDLAPEHARCWRPTVVRVDECNRIMGTWLETPGPSVSQEQGVV